jgi:hypothetical protein
MDKHYRYSVSQDLLDVAMDDAGRPFSSPPNRFKNAGVVQVGIDGYCSPRQRLLFHTRN